MSSTTTEEGAATVAPPHQGKVALRRALRTAIDVAAITPVIAAALEGADDDARVRLHRICLTLARELASLRSQLAGIDADDAVCQAVLQRMQAQDAFHADLGRMEQLWELAGIASRRLHVEHLEPEAAPVLQPVAISADAKAANRRLAVLEAFSGRTSLNSRPWRHLIDVSSVCNLRCRTCYQAKDQDFIYYDYASVGKPAVAQVMPYADYVNIGGTGEPLLSPTAADLVDAYASTGAHVEVTTNGTLPERLEAIAPCASSINISMDGATKATFDALRFGANFDKITAAIRALPDALRAKINLNCVVTRPNAAESGLFVRLARELGAGSVTFQEFHAYLPWHEDMKLRPEDRRTFFEHLEAAETREVSPTQVIVHIVRSSADDVAHGPDAQAVLDTLRKVPLPKPKRMKWPELAAAFEAVAPQALAFIAQIAADAPHTQAAAEKLATAEDLAAEITTNIAKGQAVAPSCLAPFTLLYLQGNGEMRPCCVLRTQVGSLADRTSFDAGWNDPAFVDFRGTIQGKRATHPACIGCKDGSRFSGLVEALQILSDEGLDISRIRRPQDFDVPASVADHSLVRAWGSAVADLQEA